MWIFMMIMSMLLPITMIFFGYYFRKKAPKKINNLFGYRTSMSMKNEDTWIFAHKHFGKTWLITGWILLPITLIAMILLFGKDTDTIGNIGAVLVLTQCAVLILCIFPTEIALRKTFDKNGMRKKI